MDLAHLHLLITHLPIFGALLGAFVLVYGLVTKSHQTVLSSYWVLVISALGGTVAYLTGESAEEAVEHLQGISETIIKAHEESAELTIIALAILGFLALFGLVFNSKLVTFRRTIAIVTLVLSIICFGLVARTGYLGGQIRHSEINQPNQES